MVYQYTPRGVCSREIRIDVDDNQVVRSVGFVGGCSGNTQGVAALARGRTIDELVSALGGIRCGLKSTSCPDQLAQALKAIQQEIKKESTGAAETK